MRRCRFFLLSNLLDEVLGVVAGWDSSFLKYVGDVSLAIHDDLEIVACAMDRGKMIQVIAIIDLSGLLASGDGAYLVDLIDPVGLPTLALNYENGSSRRGIFHH